MDNTRIENKIKELLDQRTLNPSPSAWDRLDAMLSVQENQKPKKWPKYTAIAASFIIFFTVAIWISFYEVSDVNDNKTFVNHLTEVKKIDTQVPFSSSLPLSIDKKSKKLNTNVQKPHLQTKLLKNAS